MRGVSGQLGEAREYRLLSTLDSVLVGFRVGYRTEKNCVPKARSQMERSKLAETVGCLVLVYLWNLRAV